MKVKIADIIVDKISGEWGKESIGDQGTPVIRTTNFTNEGKIDYNNIAYRLIDEKKIARKRIIYGDIIIEKSGGSPNQPVGRVVFFDLKDDEDYLCNNFTAVLRPDSSRVFPQYLFYILWYYHKIGKSLKYQNRTTGIINLKLNDYLEEEIPLPDLSTQRRIAHLLSEAEALIEARKESLKLLDKLAKSIFVDMFGDPVKNEKGWPETAIRKLIKVGTGGTPSRKKENLYYQNGDIPWVKTTEVNNKYIYTSEERITKIALKETNCKIYPVNTILLAMYGQGKTRGQVGLLKIEAATNQACAAIPPSSKYNSLFLFELLKLSYDQLRALGRGGNQENLNLSIVGDYIIPLPDISTQDQFAIIIGKLEEIRTDQEASLQKLERMYDALMQGVFKGNVDVSGVEIKEGNIIETLLPFYQIKTQFSEYTQNLKILAKFIAEIDPKADFSWLHVFKDPFNINDLLENLPKIQAFLKHSDDPLLEQLKPFVELLLSINIQELDLSDFNKLINMGSFDVIKNLLPNMIQQFGDIKNTTSDVVDRILDQCIKNQSLFQFRNENATKEYPDLWLVLNAGKPEDNEALYETAKSILFQYLLAKRIEQIYHTEEHSIYLKSNEYEATEAENK